MANIKQYLLTKPLTEFYLKKSPSIEGIALQ